MKLYFSILYIIASCVLHVVMCSPTSCGNSSIRLIEVYSEEEHATSKYVNGTSLSMLDEVVTNCTTVYFCSLKINLDKSLSFSNLNYISFIGLNVTTIDCGGNSSLQFMNVNSLFIRGVEFFNCAEVHTMVLNYRKVQEFYFVCGIYIENSVNINFTDVVISHASGTGVYVFSTGGIVSFTRCIFTNNGKGTQQKGNGISIEMVPHNQTTNMSICNSSYQFRYCIFEDNNAFEVDVKSTPFGRGGGLRLFLRNSASNNIIKVSHCIFRNNTASLWGGGLFISIHDEASNNSIYIDNSQFIGNRSPHGGGGAYYVGFPCNGIVQSCLNNSFLLSSCQFSSNNAKYGGATSFDSTRVFNSSISTELYNKIKHYKCTWRNNTGHYGSAISILPYTWSVLATGVFPVPVFEDCTLTNNFVTKHETRLLNFYRKSSTGAGTLYCTLFSLNFTGNLIFERNNGSAILASSCSLSFKESSTVSFTQNSGQVGGALNLLGHSRMCIQRNCSFQFINNTAERNGGAIYQQSSDILEHSYSFNCFISRSDDTSGDLIYFHFAGNQAGVGNQQAGYGNSIYSVSLLPCIRQYTNSTNHDYSIFNNMANFTFHGNIEDEISTGVSNFTVNETDEAKEYVPIIAGKYTKIPFEGQDNFFHKRRDVYTITVSKDENSTVSVDSHSSYVTDGSISLLGSPGDEAEITLSTITSHKTTLTFLVRMQECPPGYVLTESQNSKRCICSLDTDAAYYIGIQFCNASLFQANRGGIYWYGYESNKPVSDSTFITGYCHEHYCNSRSDDYLPSTASRELLNDVICKPSRIGKLCSLCKQNLTAYYHARHHKCGPRDKCYLGSLFYIISDIIPFTIVFIIVIAFNISFTSGSTTGFIFYAQVVVFFQITSLGKSYRIKSYSSEIYEMFNLQFLPGRTLSYCLFENGNTLDVIMFEYVTVFYSLFLVLVITLIFKVCDTRQIKRIFRVRVNAIKNSIIHGLSAFLVLCFFRCAKISIRLLSFTYIRGRTAIPIQRVVYFNGELEWFSMDHLKYAIPAIFISMVINVIPLTLLLIYPLCYQCLGILKLDDTKCALIFYKLMPLKRLRPFFDSFQSCYKDNCRFFSGLYFMYRILILLNVSLNYIEVFYVTLEVLLILMFLIHAIVQPYKKRVHNNIDSLLFANMAIINGLTMYNNTGLQYRNRTLWHSEFINFLQEVLLLLPILCVIIYKAYHFTKTFISRCFKSVLNKHDNGMEEYADLLTERT